jgi:PIN domain nuclease of toxin-antitoxin system
LIYLLDTHTLIWWFSTSPAMSDKARSAIEDDGATVFASAVCAFEIATKFTLGKLPEAARLSFHFEEMALGQGFRLLPVSAADASLAGRLPLHHKDPFDRLLIAQALANSLMLLSNESLFDSYGVSRLW